MDDLTNRQRQTLAFILAYFEAQGCPPTLQEIARHLQVTGNLGVMRHLAALERKGYLHRRSGARGIVLATRSGGGRAVPVPIVGAVRAGIPALAVENIADYCATDPSWLKGEGCFYLTVKGDSMIGAHICDGDLALIRPQKTADNGDIVVALVDGEATLKRFYRERTGFIRLQAENSAYAPIMIGAGEAETTIVGKLLRTVRCYA